MNQFAMNCRDRYGLKAFLAASGTAVGLAIGRGAWLALGAFTGACLLFLWPLQVSLGSFAFLVPFDSISALGSSGQGITLTFIMGAAGAIALVTAGFALQRLEFPPRASGYWFLFIAWASASLLWAYDPHTAMQQIPTMLGLFLFYLIAVSFRPKPQEFSGVITLAILGGCVAALYASSQFYSGISYFSTLRGSLIVGNRATDPNVFAASLLLPSSLAVNEFLVAQNRIRSLLMLLAVAVINLAIFLSMSRGALVGLAVMLIVYFRRLRVNWRILIPVALALGSLVLVPSSFFQRFLKAGATGGAGRLYIWESGFNAFKHYALLGAGLNNFASVYTNYAGGGARFAGLGRDAHNIYLAIAVELGAIGIALLLLAIMAQLTAVSRLRENFDKVSCSRLAACEAACWGMLTAGFFLNVIWRKSFWLCWIMLALAVKVYKYQSQHLAEAQETRSSQLALTRSAG